jgi:hypothetical protein
MRVDAVQRFDHNRPVRLHVIGRVLAFVSATALVISGALPPLHIHEASPVLSSAPLEHWHFSERPHRAETMAVFDEDDHHGPAHFLDSSGLPAVPMQQVAPDAVLNVVQALIVDPVDPSRGLDSAWLTPPSLGPPRSPKLLRAPPALA